MGDWDIQRNWIVSMDRFTGKRIELVRQMAILDWVVFGNIFGCAPRWNGRPLRLLYGVNAGRHGDMVKSG